MAAVGIKKNCPLRGLFVVGGTSSRCPGLVKSCSVRFQSCASHVPRFSHGSVTSQSGVNHVAVGLLSSFSQVPGNFQSTFSQPSVVRQSISPSGFGQVSVVLQAFSFSFNFQSRFSQGAQFARSAAGGLRCRTL